jgi:hypothetical protein
MFSGGIDGEGLRRKGIAIDGGLLKCDKFMRERFDRCSGVSGVAGHVFKGPVHLGSQRSPRPQSGTAQAEPVQCGAVFGAS